MKKLFTQLCFCFVLLSRAEAQPGTESAVLDTNQIKARINNHGSLFWNTQTGASAFEFPKDSGTHANFAAALWLGGYDNGGVLHTAAQTYNQNGFDYQIGPVSTQRNSTYLGKYNQVWKISKRQIQNHQQNYNNSGYQVPTNLATWPGNGDPSNGESVMLAPFVDLNQNGVYEPASGDYPNIRGDQAAFFILNDALSTHGASGGTPLGVEIHVMAYSYDGPPPVGQTIFVSYKIINRGNNNFPNLYASIWQDVDLGNYSDDVLGSDVGKGLFFTYNNNDVDAPGVGSYGAHPPASGCLPMGALPYAMMTFNNSGSNLGNPSTPVHFFNFMRALWKDGTALTHGGNGYNSGGVVTRYAYSWDTNPNAPSNWMLTLPQDWRMVTTAEPFALAPGDTKCVTFAFCVARENSTAIASANLLKSYAAQLRQQFDATEGSCFGGFPMGIQNPDASGVLTVWPNPADHGATLKVQAPGSGTILVFNTLGQMVSSAKINFDQAELPVLTPGAYLIRWQNPLANQFRQTLLIQK